MDRKLYVERLYSLGDFKNIKFSDEITGIPDEISNNQEAMKLLHYLQLIEIEFSFSRYVVLENKFYGPQKMPLDSILEYLENERTATFESLLKVINHKEQKND